MRKLVYSVYIMFILLSPGLFINNVALNICSETTVPAARRSAINDKQIRVGPWRLHSTLAWSRLMGWWTMVYCDCIDSDPTISYLSQRIGSQVHCPQYCNFFAFFCSNIASEWPPCFDSLMDITRHKQSITELGDNCGDLPYGPRQGSIDLGSLEYRDTETLRHRHRITN